MRTLSVLYRGPLSSCNYACGYCPFSKRTENHAALERDRHSLQRFVQWVASRPAERIKLLFTPWGEALVRSWYREAIIELSTQRHVETVAIQTNLSCDLNWIDRCCIERLSFWATFHPTEVEHRRFFNKVLSLHERGVSICVGAVGDPAHMESLNQLRRELPSDIYMWINAQKPRPSPYSRDELADFTAIDPLFPLTTRRHVSRGEHCRAGETSFTVDGRGDMRRCHFVDTVIGNIYESGWMASLESRLCPKSFCDCYVGFSQLASLELEQHFDGRVLERVQRHALITTAPHPIVKTGATDSGE
jgi:MoaA/NifB/PqqE/SkfB family radical SAM enzyme